MTATMQSIYDDTVDLIGKLDERQLTAVHSIIVELSAKNRDRISPLGIGNEEELWAHIDHSLSQAKSGLGRDADDVVYITDVFHGLEDFESKLR